MASPGQWTKVFEKLEKLTEGDKLARISIYLHLEAKDCPDYPPMLSQLKRMVEQNRDGDIRSFVDVIYKDALKAENDEAYRGVLSQINQALMPYSGKPLELQLKHLQEHMGDLGTGSLFGLSACWSAIPLETQMSILRVVTTGAPAASSSAVMRYVVGKSGTMVTVTLATVYLSYEAVTCIYRWWKGEISGQRAAKQIIDSVCSVFGGIGGGMSGGAIGGLFGPIGLVAGAILGGAAGAAVANSLVDLLTREIFDLPKSEALDRAYAFLGVSPKASNGELNIAFKRLCLQYHPDKGGKQEDFVQLQSYFSIIKSSRGEL